jgi:hypothetical protein
VRETSSNFFQFKSSLPEATMTIYITKEGNKLSAEFPAQLLEKLRQLEPACADILEDHKNEVGSRITDPETLIAYLIQNGYLSVIDPVDG